MNRRLLSIVIFVTIAVSAVYPRISNITSLPPSLFSDEVDAGYQAKTFNQNHTDYFGNKFPVHFQSFSDWRTSLYIYSVAAVQNFTSSPELSVRLPSAIFGILTIAVFFLLTRSVPAAFLLAISPWAIHYSRTGFEVSGMLLSLLTGIYFWQKHHQKRQTTLLIISIIAFSLSAYFYSTAKLFIIFMLPLCYLIWKPKTKSLIISLIVGLVVLSPLAIDTFRGRAGYRFSYISIFTLPHREQITDTLRYQDILLDHPNEIGVPTPPLSYIFHNKYQLVLERFIKNYFVSFSPEFLFLEGDKNIRQGFGQHGMLYVLDFFIILYGLYLHFHKPTSLGKLFFWMLILGPIPFALTRDSLGPHATRLIIILPSLVYFSSLTLHKIPLITPIYLLLFINFWHYYQNHYPQLSARTWHTNLKETVLATTNYPQHQIYFSDTAEPFMPFFLYYYPYLPTDSLTSHLTEVKSPYFSGKCIDSKYCFGQIDPSFFPLTAPPSLLVVPQSQQFIPPTGFTLINTLPKKYQESEVFYIYSN